MADEIAPMSDPLAVGKVGEWSMEEVGPGPATDTSGMFHDLTFHGGETYYGSLTLNSIRVDGNPNFTVGYDGAVASILSQNWRVRHWHEVPSNSVGF